MYFTKKLSSTIGIVFFLILSISTSADAVSTTGDLSSKHVNPTKTLYSLQQDTLPFPPDSIYNYIASRSEYLLDGQKIPSTLAAEQWKEDLDTLSAKIHQRVPYAEAATGGEAFHKKIDSLKQVIPNQTPDQRILSVLNLMSLPASGTGHMGIRTNQRAIGWRTLPVQPYRFADGVYIMILSVGGVPVDSVYRALKPYASSDNQWNSHDVEEDLLSFHWVNQLKALGILKQTDQVPMRIRTQENKVKHINVETMRPDTPAFVRFQLSPSKSPDTPTSLQWSPATSQQDNNEPDYRLSYRDSTDILYLDLNSFGNISEDYTMADMVDSLGTIADNRPIEKVVVDLRTNSGGSNSLGEPLLKLMGSHPKIDKRGTLYTLVSPVTFSAAGMFAMQMERRTKTIFAGENSSFAPNIWGENTLVMLPNSKITARISFHYKSSSMPNDPRSYLKPDLYVPMTSDQHFQNIDSTMIAVRQHDPEPRSTTALSVKDQNQFTGTYKISPIHRAKITSTKDGLHLRVDRGRTIPFIDTELYPLSSNKLATDITNVYLENNPGEAGLMLAWKDTSYAMRPVDSTFTLPLEHIRAGHFNKGVEGFRKAEAEGIKLGSKLTVTPLTDLVNENPLPTWPDSLNEMERAQRALPYTKLATELNPNSWLAHFELAYVYQVLGKDEQMRESAQKSLQLSTARAKRLLEEYLGLEVTANGLK